MQPLISVLICTYNGKRFLEQTINSVLAQTYPNFEIVIVDDGSTDGTQALVAKLSDQYECIRAFYRSNHGLPASRNFSFAQAHGEWIAIIDQDDLCYPSRLERQLAIASENPTAKLIFCDVDFINEHNQVIGHHLERFDLPPKFIRRGLAGNLLLAKGCYVDSEAFFMHKDSALAAGPFDESLRYTCDYEYFIRVGLFENFAYTQEVLAAWRVHDDQATATFPRIRAQVRAVYRRFFWNKHVSVLTKVMLIKNMLRSYVGQLLDALKC
jgi:glycosyltransferase involved in cell wall biosynthesis